MLILPTPHPKFRDGNSTSLKGETLTGCLQTEEEGHHPAHQDLHLVEVEVVGVEGVEAVEEEEEEGHSHYPGKHLPNILRSF